MSERSKGRGMSGSSLVQYGRSIGASSGGRVCARLDWHLQKHRNTIYTRVRLDKLTNKVSLKERSCKGGTEWKRWWYDFSYIIYYIQINCKVNRIWLCDKICSSSGYRSQFTSTRLLLIVLGIDSLGAGHSGKAEPAPLCQSDVSKWSQRLNMIHDLWRVESIRGNYYVITCKCCVKNLGLMKNVQNVSADRWVWVCQVI